MTCTGTRVCGCERCLRLSHATEVAELKEALALIATRCTEDVVTLAQVEAIARKALRASAGEAKEAP